MYIICWQTVMRSRKTILPHAITIRQPSRLTRITAVIIVTMPLHWRIVEKRTDQKKSWILPGIRGLIQLRSVM